MTKNKLDQKLEAIIGQFGYTEVQKRTRCGKPAIEPLTHG